MRAARGIRGVRGARRTPALRARVAARRAARVVVAAIAAIAASTSGAQDGGAPDATGGAPPRALDGFARFVGADGSFRFAGARDTERLAHLGSWFVPEGPASGLHHVYTQPEAIAAHRETGVFPDGTVLVKEVVDVARASYTTGADVASATVTKQWFVMVKDARGRFPGNPLWGNGWGWALFAGDAPSTNTARDLRTDCLACHVPARATDWVYVQGYPALRRATPPTAEGEGGGTAR
ncbi:MAG: cytochrome P460 family protein [Myxococcota bacterium]